jgi:hypothetical protein
MTFPKLFRRRDGARRLPSLLFLVGTFFAFLVSDAVAQVNITIGSGTTLNGGTARVNVSGDWTNDGTFTPDASTVVFSGSGSQSVSGTTSFFGLGVDKNGGTFTLSTATSVNGQLDLLSGTLDNSGANVALGDGATIRRATGSLSASPTFGSTVTVEYVGDTDVSTGNELPDPSSGTSVSRLAVRGAGTVTLTKAVTVTEALLLENGSLDNSTAEVTVASGATVEPGGGALSETPTYQGPVELTYDGSGALSTGTELPGTVDRLTVNAPGGLTLGKDVTVTDALSVQQGTMDLGGFTVILDPGATLVEQPGAVVSGETGQIQATRTLNAPSDVDVAGLGFTITSSANLGATTITRTHARPFNATDIAIARVYDVAPAQGSGLNATITLRYDDSERLFPDIEDPLRLYRSTDGGTSWTEQGGTVDKDANTVTLSGVDDFSLWTIGAPAAVLPVELTHFDAQVDGEAAVLVWETASETNNAGFEVQHRAPEQTAFSALEFVEGAGTTDASQRYTYRVSSLGAGTHAFRLRQVDTDGTATLTDEVSVRLDVARVVSVRPNHPNPFRAQTHLAFTVAEDGLARMEVYNLLGQRVATLFDGPATAGRVHRVTADGSRWASGVYFYVLRANGQRSTGRMTVVR